MAKPKKAKMITAAFRNRGTASRVHEWLLDRGYRSDEINVLMSDKTRATFTEEDDENKITVGSHAAEGAATGGAVGTAIGATLGAIAAVGAVISLPGIGLIVAGPLLAPLAGAIAGGGAGAVAGGAVGALVGLGIPENNVAAYEETLREGGIVFGVVPHSSDDGKSIEEFFEEQGGENVVYV